MNRLFKQKIHLFSPGGLNIHQSAQVAQGGVVVWLRLKNLHSGLAVQLLHHPGLLVPETYWMQYAGIRMKR